MPASMNLHFRGPKIIFLQAAKCGTTSVTEAITPLMGAHNQSALRRTAIPKIGPLDAFDAGHRGYLRLAVCRNPFERLVSCWRDKVNDRDHPNLLKHGVTRGMEFGAFVQAVAITSDNAETDVHIRSQSWDWQHDKKPCWDVLVPLESIEDRWGDVTDRIREHCGITVDPIKRLNESKADAPEWTPDLVALVRDRYAQDFEMLGYPTEPPEADKTVVPVKKTRRPRKKKDPTPVEAANIVAQAATAMPVEETAPTGGKNSVIEGELEPPDESERESVEAQLRADEKAAFEAHLRLKDTADV